MSCGPRVSKFFIPFYLLIPPFGFPVAHPPYFFNACSSFITKGSGLGPDFTFLDAIEL